MATPGNLELDNVMKFATFISASKEQTGMPPTSETA